MIGGQTPVDTIRRRLELAQALAQRQQRANTPLGQGLYSLAQMFAARKAGKLADEVSTREASDREASVNVLGEMLKNGNVDPSRLGEIQDSKVQELAFALALQQAKPRDPEDVVKALDDDGNPVWVLKSRAAGMPAPLNSTSATSRIGQVPPGQYTPESVQRYSETGNYADLERFEPYQEVMVGGVPYIRDAVNGNLYPAQNNSVPITARDVADNAATVEAGKAAGSSAIEQSDEAIKKLNSIRSSVANMNDAIAAIDAGADTGPIVSRLPSVKAASVELDNVRASMGLDVINSATFGALSGQELRFALDKALPTNLPPKELRDWLVRKRDAQERLAAELEKAAIYLGAPGNTPAGYLQSLKDKPRPPDQSGLPADLPPPDGMQEGTRAVNDETGEVFVIKNGGWERAIQN